MLTCAAETLLTGLPEPHVKPALDELVVPRLPNVLDSLAPVVPLAAAAAPDKEKAVQFSWVVLAQWLCHPPGPLTPVAAAHGGEREGEGEADREEDHGPLPPGAVHGRMRCAVSG